MKRIVFLAWWAVVVGGHAGPVAAAEVGSLRLVTGDYPRAFYFRQSERAYAAPSFEQWSGDFGGLMGIMGKALDEEVPGRGANAEFFARFKAARPEQAVLLHVNGNSRDPRFEGPRFFAGHWLYHNGATITAAVFAESGETTVAVADATLFEVNGGRYRNANDDVALCELDAQGRPDWTRSEQVQLVAVDRRAKTIRVRRGAFGTAPRAFAAGRAYAAAHVAEGPWGKDSHLLWVYNFATNSPRDAQGRSCADVVTAHLAELFAPGGRLAAFDGLEFDVLFDEPTGARGRKARGPDCDADGQRDNGIVGGANVYGNGVVAFCHLLRAVLGDRRLILADGSFRNENQQRAFGLLNGIESEGWPSLQDKTVSDWSGGLNRQLFWAANSRAPAFSYINHKFTEPAGGPGDPKQAEVGFNIHRLVMAAAVLTDSALTYVLMPPGNAPRRTGIWDEVVAGTERRIGWLGRPLAPAEHLAARAPDIVASAGAGLVQRLTSDDAKIEADGGVVKLVARQSAAKEFSVRVRGIATGGPDLMVTLRARAAPMERSAPERARLVHARVVAPGEADSPRFMSWINGREFVSTFYFGGVKASTVEIEFTFESGEPVWIAGLTAHAAPDLLVREFAHGLVVANPAPHSATLDLAGLFPGRAWQRLQATPGQDVRTNNGAAVSGELELGAKDALFLRKR
jgi:hypothetical protein